MAETGIPQRLICPNGDTLVFNDWASEATNGLLMIFEVQGLDSPVLRVTTDDRPQRPGVILHPSQHGARLPTISGRIIPSKVGGVTQSVVISDRIRAAADSLLAATGRYCWTPTGKAERFLEVRMNGDLVMDADNSVRSQDGQSMIKSFALPLIAADPIAKTLAETDMTFDDGAALGTITNGGNVNAYPVLQVTCTGGGPLTGFTVANDTLAADGIPNPQIVISGISLGIGDYSEIVMRDETIFKNGDGADQLHGLDVATSNFFWLKPGANQISLSALVGGATVTVLVKSNDAWG